MKLEQRLYSPYWPIEHNRFMPIQWRSEDFSEEAKKVIEIIKQEARSPDEPIFIRGSIIESLHPDPRSDIDIVVIRSQLISQSFLRSFADSFRRPLDINIYSQDALEPKTHLLPLIHICSYQASGPFFERKPVEIDRHFIFELWNQYAVYSLPQQIVPQDRFRISYLKQLLRVQGLLSLLAGDGFTRHIPSCLTWLSAQNPQLGHLAQQIWDWRSSDQILFIEPIVHWTVERFEWLVEQS